MSRQSKAKRDARRKHPTKSGPVRAGRPIQAHAHLLDGDGKVIGGAGHRDEQWSVIFNGKIVANTDSPGMVIAMLTHIAALREQAGHAAQTSYSPELRELATAEAQLHGKTLPEYLDMLEAERLERVAERAS
ncbi:hypothetical protein [Arenimonas oryziterrae]|uniref:Uncharacterized protein n=1 Tax=Arenimonas oryziterrae DSM 21050 = YC6267 TaxID=1121015 RepID=A0A091ATY0_9GAMM|nr:hypothetical protein [Arenimonas oryziterrae]KFN43653.1 hypothetical protein N789_10275 [Arenimonas oryziterrae DSM 21050 = YC6267]